MQHGVEEEEEAPLRLLTPHRIVGEQEDVAFAHGDINDGRAIRQLVASGEHAGDEEVALFSEAQHNARSLLRWRQKRAHEFAHLFRES